MYSSKKYIYLHTYIIYNFLTDWLIVVTFYIKNKKLKRSKMYNLYVKDAWKKIFKRVKLIWNYS